MRWDSSYQYPRWIQSRTLNSRLADVRFGRSSDIRLLKVYYRRKELSGDCGYRCSLGIRHLGSGKLYALAFASEQYWFDDGVYSKFS